jgi:hypothetical protein
MFWTLKFNFNADIFALFGLATVWATSSKNWAKLFHNHLVTLLPNKIF